MFNTARIKLTAWYLLMIMCVSIFFSTVIYAALTHELDRFDRAQRIRIQRGIPAPPPFLTTPDPDLISETKHRLIMQLALLNGGILVMSGVMGYFLAGFTLRPIKEMVDEQNRFIGDASHEFRTPLTSLKSALEVHLRDTKLTVSQARTVIKESIDEVNKMNMLSDRLLHLARYEQGEEFFFRKLVLSKIIDYTIIRIKPSLLNYLVLFLITPLSIAFRAPVLLYLQT